MHEMKAESRKGSRRQGLLAVAVALTLTLFLAGAAEARPKVEAEQGSLAQWAGEGTETCGMDGRQWAALDGVCYFPVDLERSPGTVEIARWRNGGSIETAWLVVQEKVYDLQEIEIDEKFVNLSEENLQRLYSEQAEIKPLFRRRSGEAQFTLPLGQPLDPPVPDARFFGARREFNGVPKNPHSGSDYAVGMGNAVKAVADGEVVLIGDHFFAGKSVYLYHGNGLVSMYFHLSEATVEKGQEVSKGDTIAKVGSTGRSTGPHLHLGFRWMGDRIDPATLLNAPSALPAVSE